MYSSDWTWTTCDKPGIDIILSYSVGQLISSLILLRVVEWISFFPFSFQIFDKLCQSFGGDVLQTLFNSAEGLANCTEENMRFWIWRFVSDQALAMAATNILIVSSFFLMLDANFIMSIGSLTLLTCSFFHFISSGNYFINLYCCSQ